MSQFVDSICNKKNWAALAATISYSLMMLIDSFNMYPTIILKSLKQIATGHKNEVHMSKYLEL